MATGSGNLPHTPTYVSPFDVITSQAENETQDNIVSLATGAGIGDGAIGTTQLADASVTSDKVAWETFINSSFSAYLSTSQTNANGAVVALDTVEYNPGNCFSTTAHEFTAPVKGLYHFDGAVSTVVGTGILASLMRVSTTYGNTRRRGAWIGNAASYIISPVSTDFRLDAGDKVRLECTVISGTPTLSGGVATDMGNYMSGRLVYPL